MARSSRAWHSAAVLALAALIWLAWSLVPVPPPERPVSPAGVPSGSVAAVESDSTRDVAPPAGRGGLEGSDVGRAGESSPDVARADLIGRVEGLELPHGYGEVRVALWPDGLQPDCAHLAAAGAETFPLRVVPVAPDGSFRFGGLPPQGTFQLRAGGAAHVSSPLEQAVQPSAAVVLLRLVRLKGLEL